MTHEMTKKKRSNINSILPIYGGVIRA